MHVRCPHCHNPLELVDDAALRDIVCTSCGGKFSLVGDDLTKTYHPKNRKIAHFELIEQVGIGAFGSVWKAKDTQLDRLVAVKIPRLGQLDPEEAEAFLREARAAAQLKHPNIVTVHEVGRDGSQLYIVSDYVQGANLREWLSGTKPTLREAAELCAKIATALHHAHEKGVIHRDVKPRNIMMDSDDEPHVMDFGLAKRNAGEITITMDGKVLGSPAYMSPEQAAGKSHEVDGRADVYALGVILFELLTGELPFRGDKAMLLLQIQRDEPPSPRKLNSRIPRDLETICLKCLRKEPDRRYASAQELAADLRRWLGGESILARPVSRIEKTWVWCRRRPTLVGSVLAILAVLVIAAGVVSWQRNENAKRIAAQEVANDRERAASLVDSALTAPPDALPYAIENLRPLAEHALLSLRECVADNTRPASQRIHAACTLADFGETDATFLASAVGAARPAECANIAVALDHDREPALAALHSQSREVEKGKDFTQKARLAIVATYLDDFAIAADMLKIADRPDPVQRTVLIHELATWHGDVGKLAPLVAKNPDGALRSGIALGVGGFSQPDNSSKEVWRRVLSEWYLQQPDAVTHSAAGWALRQWNLPEPKLESRDQAKPGTNWIATKTGFTLVRIPAGKFVRTDPHFLPPTTQEVTLTHDFWLSDREVSVSQFRAFMDDATYTGPKQEKWEGEYKEYSPTPQHPVQQVNWYDAVMFCNWLSARENQTPCYELTGEKEKIAGVGEYLAWRLKAGGTGYRLPTEAEGEYACRAGTTTVFSSGEDEKRLAEYAVFLGSKTELPGSRRCNGWGLFDMHGNVWEWCYDWSESFPRKATVSDPLGPAQGSVRVLRGGSFDPNAVSLRSAFRNLLRPGIRFSNNGFRVARTYP